jgi:hypothetical protein
MRGNTGCARNSVKYKPHPKILNLGPILLAFKDSGTGYIFDTISGAPCSFLQAAKHVPCPSTSMMDALLAAAVGCGRDDSAILGQICVGEGVGRVSIGSGLSA